MLRTLAFALCCVCLSAVLANGASVAVFPLQELGDGRNDANLPLSNVLAQRLKESGNDIIAMDTVITFLARNRIRTLGRLETFHIDKVRNDLGATFVLLGTVSQRKERPEASIGLTLTLIRTSDARTVWSYVGSFSTGEERRILGISEPQSVAELQPLLIAEVLDQWPWKTINEAQQAGTIHLDAVILQPSHVRPGDEVRGRVRLRRNWSADQAPRVFFKADEQLYPATASPDGNVFEGSWVAGQENGRFPVTLLLEWPHYGRTETALLGNYLIDGTAPLFEMEFQGTQMLGGQPMFHKNLIIRPKPLIRKPLARWKLTFNQGNGSLVGAMEEPGNLPDSFIWSATDSFGSLQNGMYEVILEAWDLAGNTARVSKMIELNRSAPELAVNIDRTDEGVAVDLEQKGKIPLAFWRMEMWTKEGRILSQEEGDELPVKIEVKLPESEEPKEIEGFVFMQDVLGNQTRRRVDPLMQKLDEKNKPKAVPADQSKGISESWVNEF